ncbi:microtubule-actin cross-linking factor 1, isoforms 6/7-like [Struthio camelus]|uniref:microtubule-actin cross-linking factor 1, isoforms 6/7-like n=1 Tax=Struthio camelus TaxID=8801 RepID=UPI00360404FD
MSPRAWTILNKVWTERYARLEEQLQASLSYQETMQRLFEWLDTAELRIAEEFLVGGDLDMVQQQLAELKEFKRELYQCKVDVESLRHQAGLGSAGHGEPPAPLSDFRQRWDRLEEEIVSRQHQLEAALLGLGQFQHQLEELLQWLSRTSEQLQGPTLLRLDLQSCEIELAKHKVLRNDVMSHARTVQSVNEAGQGLLLSSLGESVEGLQRSLQQLNQHWDVVQSETESRQLELENNLSQVQDITLEITELLQWLEHVELQLFFSKPTWGHPDTTKEKLTAHLELCKEMESKQHTYDSVRDRLQRLLASCRAARPCSTEHSLRILEQKWESVYAEAQERKERLAEGLTAATEFHGTMQDLLRWMGRAEETLGSPAPPSFVLDTVTAQIQEHKALVKEVNAHGEKLSSLEAVASRLKDFSRKQDGAAIQNLVLTAKERLARVLQRTAERGAALEEARKRTKQFSESRRLLLDWMDEVEQTLEVPQDTATSQEEIKCQLAEHKAFQKVLRSKRPVYEATLRSGRALRERAQLPEDLQPLEELLGELKERWDALCSRAVERQHKLEENLLFSGKFTDALQALMDWLYRAEPQLSEDVPVGGDRDLVGDLMDKHKVFQKELGKRASCIKMLKRSVRDLTRGSSSVDSQWLQRQMEELSTRWDLVCKLSVSKQARLEASLRQAEEFHTLVHAFLGRLSESEKTLKYGMFPEEEEAAVQECQHQLQELMKSLQCQQLELECITSLGEEILSTCHPDSVITIKSWVTVAKSRFQEVLSWAQQQGERLQAQTASLAAEREEVAQLIDWITAAEEALSLRDQEPLPEDAEQLEELNAQHAVFVEELNRKQPDVEKVTKSCKRKLATELGPPATRRLATRRRSAGKAQGTPAVPLGGLEPQTPLMAQLLHRWQQLWLLALDRQYRLETALQRLRELEEFAHFDFGVWRKRYMQWIGQMKSRVLDVFRGIDRDQDGRISQREFIESVLASKFPTNVLEMKAVASIFDLNGDGFIDYYEFVSALHPNRDPLRRTADADQIQDEVNRQVAQCNCAKRFQVEQISANRYRFGESQQLRMVRILRSTLMVRVGGGWIALDEFLVKNDPCRVKGRTNLKINEKYLSPDAFGAAAAKCAGNQSAPSSKVLSPSRSNSSLSLYSSASAPSSPLARKSVLRRTRSGDRCPRSRGSLLPDGAELQFAAAEESLDAAPPDSSQRGGRSGKVPEPACACAGLRIPGQVRTEERLQTPLGAACEPSPPCPCSCRPPPEGRAEPCRSRPRSGASVSTPGTVPNANCAAHSSPLTEIASAPPSQGNTPGNPGTSLCQLHPAPPAMEPAQEAKPGGAGQRGCAAALPGHGTSTRVPGLLWILSADVGGSPRLLGAPAAHTKPLPNPALGRPMPRGRCCWAQGRSPRPGQPSPEPLPSSAPRLQTLLPRLGKARGGDACGAGGNGTVWTRLNGCSLLRAHVAAGRRLWCHAGERVHTGPTFVLMGAGGGGQSWASHCTSAGTCMCACVHSHLHGHTTCAQLCLSVSIRFSPAQERLCMCGCRYHTAKPQQASPGVSSHLARAPRAPFLPGWRWAALPAPPPLPFVRTPGDKSHTAISPSAFLSSSPCPSFHQTMLLAELGGAPKPWGCTLCSQCGQSHWLGRGSGLGGYSLHRRGSKHAEHQGVCRPGRLQVGRLGTARGGRATRRCLAPCGRAQQPAWGAASGD